MQIALTTRFVRICSIVVSGVPIAARIANPLLAFVFGLVGGGLIAVFHLKYGGYSHWWDRGILQRFNGLFVSVLFMIIFGAVVFVSARGSAKPLQVEVFVAVIMGHLLALTVAIYALAKKEDKL